MNPIDTLFSGIQQLLLLVFVLMVLVGIAGGNPASVLSPLLELTTRLLVGLAGLLVNVLTALLKALVTLIPALLRAAGSAAQATPARKIK